MPWPTIQPGDLRHKIEIQSRTTDQDALGQPVETWETFITTQAAIATTTGKELYALSQITAQVSHTITMRWSFNPTQIIPGMRVKFSGNPDSSPPTVHYYKIQWIDNVEQRNVLLKLYCFEFNGAE